MFGSLIRLNYLEEHCGYLPNIADPQATVLIPSWLDIRFLGWTYFVSIVDFATLGKGIVEVKRIIV
jgi:hypothetical protein